jgi:hypothetical protein
MALSIHGDVIMNRLLTTGAALSILLGMTGVALAQGVNPGPYYSAPAYGQSMPPQQAAVPQQYAPKPYPQTEPVADPHSTGGAGRAYWHGQKTN